MQEFDYTIEHIEGEANVVADAFSRMCPISDKTEYLHTFQEYSDKKRRTLQKRLETDEWMCEYCPTTLDSTEYCFGIRDIRKPTQVTHEIYDATALPANVYKAIIAVHNSITGHHGLERTLWKLTNNNQKWKHMREDVRQVLNECPYCQNITQIKTPIITRRYTNHTYKPMQCINVDTR